MADGKAAGGFWTLNRLFCRLVAAWSCVTAFRLAGNPDFAELAWGQDASLAGMLFWIAVLFAVFTGVGLLFWRWKLQSDSWFLLGGATVCVGVWLGNAPAGENQYGVLFLLAVMLVYCLFVLYVLQENRALLDRVRLGRRWAWLIALLGAGVSCAVIAGITVLRYRTFSSPNYDFGLFVNMFCNMKRTGLPLCTSERDRLLSHFAVHISPVWYLLYPVWCLFPTPETLQIAQAVVLMLGVVPVLLLCRQKGLSGRATAAVGLLYVFYPLISTGCFYDIHENCFLTLFLLLTFYFFEARHPVPMFLSALLVLSVKEDAAVYLLFFALYVLLGRRKYVQGLALGALAGGYFVLTAYLLRRYGLGMMVNRFNNLIYDKDAGLLGALKTAVVNPGYLLTQLFTTSGRTWEKVTYFCQLFLPLGMLPFCAKKASRWLLVAPVLVNFLTYYQYQYHSGFQYHFGIAAFLFYALILNLPELGGAGMKQRLLGVACACTLCCYLYSVIPVLGNYRARWESGRETYAQMEAILDTVPDDASVCCSTFLLAHMADRAEIYELAYHGNKPDVDYVVIDARYSSAAAYRRAYLAQGYTVASEHPGLIVILKKG